MRESIANPSKHHKTLTENEQFPLQKNFQLFFRPTFLLSSAQTLSQSVLATENIAATSTQPAPDKPLPLALGPQKDEEKAGTAIEGSEDPVVVSRKEGN